MRKTVLAGSLALALLGAQAQQPGQQELAAQQAIPDAPRPQTTLPSPGSLAPGKGTTSSSAGDTGLDSDPAPGAVLASPPPRSEPPASSSEPPPIMTSTPDEIAKAYTIVGAGINYVEVPFIVKDSKGRPVAGIQPRDVHVYENGLRQSPVIFNVAPRAMSVALVIDQSITTDNMIRVNDSLGALPGAFAPYDEIAVFKYNNGPSKVTDLTGAQSARLIQALDVSKGTGREPPLAGALDGPMAHTTVVNNQSFDPNTDPNRGHTSMQVNIPKEIHTLNDAILAAAVSLSKVPIERLRVIYVISDGREAGSTAKFKDVVHYLQANRIAVYGTLVGDSSLPVIGFLDRMHLPFMMRDNALVAYKEATGGDLDAEFRTGGIEKSFARIAAEVRNQYTIGYYTHEPFIDGKYRPVEVVVMNHGNDLTIIAKKGYYPGSVEAVRPHAVTAGQ